MILGFTGTRAGWTPAQREMIRSTYVDDPMPATVLNGGAPGADEELICWLLDNRDALGAVRIEVYPCNEGRARYWRRYLAQGLIDAVHRLEEPLVRNRVIATRCDRLLATPNSTRETLRSGTWSTVRYARTAGKRVTLVLPDGTVREEGRPNRALGATRNAAPRDTVGDQVERQFGSLPLDAHFTKRSRP